MKIVYHCYGGAHSSVTAAAVHLGWLPTDRLPDEVELKRLPYFDRTTSKDHGHIRFMGRDRYDNEIFVLGRRNCTKIFENMAKGLIAVFGKSKEEYLFFNVMPYVNWKMVLGGYTSRRLGITNFGRPIIIRGVLASYWKIVSFVQRVIVTAASSNEGERK
jgi:hypothetical protein